MPVVSLIVHARKWSCRRYSASVLSSSYYLGFIFPTVKPSYSERPFFSPTTLNRTFSFWDPPKSLSQIAFFFLSFPIWGRNLSQGVSLPPLGSHISEEEILFSLPHNCGGHTIGGQVLWCCMEGGGSHFEGGFLKSWGWPEIWMLFPTKVCICGFKRWNVWCSSDPNADTSKLPIYAGISGLFFWEGERKISSNSSFFFLFRTSNDQRIFFFFQEREKKCYGRKKGKKRRKLATSISCSRGRRKRRIGLVFWRLHILPPPLSPLHQSFLKASFKKKNSRSNLNGRRTLLIGYQGTVNFPI